jgi:phosphatidate cytidylyltransferase
MKSELLKRIITSVIIFSILLFVLANSKFYLLIFLFSLYFLSFYEIYKNSSSVKFTLFSNIFLLTACYSFYYLRGNTDKELIFLCWALFATFLSDIGGYTFGKIFGGKKLTKISPNKTYSGAIGSLVFSLLSLPILFYFQKNFLKEVLINFFQLTFYLQTLLISLVAQLGDIVVSYWKRRFKIKDTGKIFPGHGGVLDRIDGLIFVLIFLLILKTFISV